jgi:hypothetical protein
MSLWYVTEEFTPEERAKLEPYFTNLEGPVFALTNLPEVVKGALFARYSRTTKSIRRLFLDEFAKDVEGFAVTGHVGTERAERLYDNVRAGQPAPREGDRVGPPGRVPRAVDALHALRRQARRPLAPDRPARDRRHAGRA